MDREERKLRLKIIWEKYKIVAATLGIIVAILGAIGGGISLYSYFSIDHNNSRISSPGDGDQVAGDKNTFYVSGLNVQTLNLGDGAFILNSDNKDVLVKYLGFKHKATFPLVNVTVKIKEETAFIPYVAPNRPFVYGICLEDYSKCQIFDVYRYNPSKDGTPCYTLNVTGEDRTDIQILTRIPDCNPFESKSSETNN